MYEHWLKTIEHLACRCRRRTMQTPRLASSTSSSRFGNVSTMRLDLTYSFSVFHVPTCLIRRSLADSWCVQAAALAFYILSALFSSNFVIIFVLTVFLAALDFWVVKNVSGRILVGLRWWNEINDQGESIWKFECLDQEVVFFGPSNRRAYLDQLFLFKPVISDDL